MKITIRRVLAAALLAVAASAAQAGAKEDIQADIQAGRWSQADARLQQVLQKHPDNALAHYWLAQVAWHEGRVDEAREHLKRAEALDPQHAFASDKKVLNKLERDLLASTGTTPRPARSEPPPPSTSTNAIAPVEAAPATVMDRPRSSGHSSFWLFAALIALVAFIVWAMRAASGRQRNSEFALVKGQLQEASNDLRDAGKAIDFRSDLSMEQRLALSDRVVRAQGDIANHLATLSARSDFTQSHELLRRVRDIAAEVRGEPRPSELEAQRALDAQRWQGAPMPMAQPSMGGPGIGGVGAALGGLAAGVVIGEMMSGSAHARTASAGDGSRYTRIDEFDPGSGSPSTSDFDLGGSGDASWDSGGGGGDVGGGGGGDFD